MELIQFLQGLEENRTCVQNQAAKGRGHELCRGIAWSRKVKAFTWVQNSPYPFAWELKPMGTKRRSKRKESKHQINR